MGPKKDKPVEEVQVKLPNIIYIDTGLRIVVNNHHKDHNQHSDQNSTKNDNSNTNNSDNSVVKTIKKLDNLLLNCNCRMDIIIDSIRRSINKIITDQSAVILELQEKKEDHSYDNYLAVVKEYQNTLANITVSDVVLIGPEGNNNITPTEDVSNRYKLLF